MKLSKIKIEQMANEIMNLLNSEGVSSDTLIYFNNKRMSKNGVEEREYYPKDYFEYAAENHILSMSFAGAFYHVINYTGGNILDKFEELLEKYGVYYELGNSWNLTCYPIDCDMEVEYTYYNATQEPIRIYDLEDKTIPYKIRNIGYSWREFQDRIGDVGSCVCGAGFEFKYEGKSYFLTPCSRYQGSISWETDKDIIHNMLNTIGATEIRYNWGVMD